MLGNQGLKFDDFVITLLSIKLFFCLFGLI